MRKYLLLIFSLSSQLLLAQDYQNICTPGTSFYRSLDYRFMAFRRDSMIPGANNDTTFLSYRAIRDTVEYFCADTTNGSLLGLKIVKNHEGWFYFFNRSGDTIKINSQASLDQTWKFCMLPGNGYIEAKVASIGPDTVLGLTDPIKTIIFQAKDAANNNIIHNLNQKTIKLSQHYGLSKMLDVYSIPEDTAFFLLAGKTVPAIGIQDLTWQDIYHFEAGDVFHFSGWSYLEGWKTIYKVLSKTLFGSDSVIYAMEHCDKIVEPNYPYYETIHDTITVRYILASNPGNSWLSRLPEEFIRQSSYPGADSYEYSVDSSRNRRQKFVSWGAFISVDDTCWAPSDGWNYPISTGIYSEGLGKVLTYWRQFTGTAWLQMQEELVYYRKGAESWGTPVSTDCFTLVGIPSVTGTMEAIIRVCPNPVETSAEIEIVGLTENSNACLVIRDFLGRMIRQDKMGTNPYTFNRDGLPAGLYFLSVFSGNGIRQAQVKMVLK